MHGVDILPSSSDNESELGFGLNEEVAGSLCLSSGINETGLGSDVLLVVLFSVGSDGLSLLSSLFSLLISSLLEFLQELGVSGLLLLHALWHDSIHN